MAEERFAPGPAAPAAADPGVAADLPGAGRRGRAGAALGLFLLVTAAYCLSAPGRIDSVDGQYRYEVSRSLVTIGEPVIGDPAILFVPGLDGKHYSAYGASASLAAAPLVGLGGLAPDPLGERRRFLFSMTTPVFGGLLAAVLFLFLGDLGVPVRAAAGWTLVNAFASLVWPASTSVLDQVQHAFFVLAAAWCGWLAARRRSVPLAAAACLALAALINYQPNYLLLVPPLALVTLARPADGGRRDRRSWLVTALVLLGGALGLGLMFHYNEIRFGTPFFFDLLDAAGQPPLFGDPLRGIAGLLASPGKSVFLYSPTIVLGLIGFAGLRRRSRAVAWTVAATSAIHFPFIASLSFFHGDWAWGPRYLVVLLPLWALAMPFGRAPRWLAGGLVAAGVAVQLLGLATVHERFFYERGLRPHFWWPQDDFYFRESALLARPRELLQTVAQGPPPEAERFAPTHRPGYHNSFILGPVPASTAPEWMHRYRVFYRPRPWPLWALAEPAGTLPVSLPLAVGLLAALGAVGAAAVARGLKLAGGGPAGVPA
jgi:hypothetical protein